MTQPIVITILTIGLAGLLGFAAQGASICTVRAVEEVLTTRRGYMLVSFGKIVLWIVLTTFVLRLTLPSVAVQYSLPSVTSVCGGFLFGIGATLNGGCAISMLANLAGGRLSMLFSLAGMALGAAGYFLFAPPAHTRIQDVISIAPASAEIVSISLVVILSLWALRELYRMVHDRDRGQSLGRHVRSRSYRLSTAAVLIGGANAVLLVVHGSWTLTHVMNRLAMQGPATAAEIHWIYWALLLSVIGGMSTSAVLQGRFRLQWRPNMRWVARFLGGALMGLGAAMVPGGNDELIFSGIPSLSTNALVAFAAILVGVAVSLKFAQLTGQKIALVDCSGDVCTAR